MLHALGTWCRQEVGWVTYDGRAGSGSLQNGPVAPSWLRSSCFFIICGFGISLSFFMMTWKLIEKCPFLAQLLLHAPARLAGVTLRQHHLHPAVPAAAVGWHGPIFTGAAAMGTSFGRDCWLHLRVGRASAKTDGLMLAGVGQGSKGAVVLSEVGACLHALHQA